MPKFKWFFIMIVCLIQIMELATISADMLSGQIAAPDGEPIPWVEIYDCRGECLGMTDPSGRFRLVLPKFTSKLFFKRLGYFPDSLSLSSPPETGSEILRTLQPVDSSPECNYRSYGSIDPILDSVRGHLQVSRSRLHGFDLCFHHRVQISRIQSGLLGAPMNASADIYGWFGYRHPGCFQQQVVRKNKSGSELFLSDILYPTVHPYWGDSHFYLDELAVLSPLAHNSQDYYAFCLLDELRVEERCIWVIALYPLDNKLPLLSGCLFIQEDGFRILELRGETVPAMGSGLRRGISLEVHYRPDDTSGIIPVFQTFRYTMDTGLPGFTTLQIAHYMLFSSHRINPVSLLTEEAQIIHKNRNTPRVREYVAQTGIATLPPFGHHHPSDQDRLSRWLGSQPVMMIRNRLSEVPLTQWSDLYHFNPVEGHTLGLGLDGRYISRWTPLSIGWGYGLGDRAWKTHLSAAVPVSGGMMLQMEYFNGIRFVDPFNAYSLIGSTYESLILKEYNPDFIREELRAAALGKEWSTGLETRIRFGVADQRSVTYSTTWSLFNRDRRPRSPLIINSGRMVMSELELHWRTRRYDDFGLLRKRRLNLEFTDVSLYLARGWSDPFNFTQFHASLWINREASYFRWISLAVQGGILWGDPIIQRGFHLPSDQPILAEPNSFKTLPGDLWIGDQYACFFLEMTTPPIAVMPEWGQRWDGFVFTQWGWLSPLTMNQPGYNPIDFSRRPLGEIGAGIGDIAGIIRIEVAFPLTGSPQCRWAFRLGSRIEF